MEMIRSDIVHLLIAHHMSFWEYYRMSLDLRWDRPSLKILPLNFIPSYALQWTLKAPCMSLLPHSHFGMLEDTAYPQSGHTQQNSDLSDHLSMTLFDLLRCPMLINLPHSALSLFATQVEQLHPGRAQGLGIRSRHWFVASSSEAISAGHQKNMNPLHLVAPVIVTEDSKGATWASLDVQLLPHHVCKCHVLFSHSSPMGSFEKRQTNFEWEWIFLSLSIARTTFNLLSPWKFAPSS